MSSYARAPASLVKYIYNIPLITFKVMSSPVGALFSRF